MGNGQTGHGKDVLVLCQISEKVKMQNRSAWIGGLGHGETRDQGDQALLDSGSCALKSMHKV